MGGVVSTVSVEEAVPDGFVDRGTRGEADGGSGSGGGTRRADRRADVPAGSGAEAVGTADGDAGDSGRARGRRDRSGGIGLGGGAGRWGPGGGSADRDGLAGGDEQRGSPAGLSGHRGPGRRRSRAGTGEGDCAQDRPGRPSGRGRGDVGAARTAWMTA